MTFLDFRKKKCFGAKMDQMCPNWPKNEVFVSFLKFKPSDSADFAYSSSFLSVLNYYCNKIGWKKFLGWKFDRLQIIIMVFGYFLMFSSLEIVDFAHLSYFRLCLSIYLVFGLWKYPRPLNLAVSKLFFVSKLKFLPSKVTCVQLTCTFK